MAIILTIMRIEVPVVESDYYTNLVAGWVEDKSIPQDIKDLMKAEGYFIKPYRLSLISQPARKAKDYAEQMRERFGKDLVFVAIRDEETWEGWTVSPIHISDLRRGPDGLLQESLDSLKRGDSLQEHMKRATWMVLTGWADTK